MSRNAAPAERDHPTPDVSAAARLAIAAGALFGATGVAIGAFAAHALKVRLAAEALALVETAARYQLIHALTLVAVGVLAMIRPSRAAASAAVFLSAGIALFCGSLYALGLGAPRWLGMIAPMGGLALIAGWLLLLAAALKRN